MRTIIAVNGYGASWEITKSMLTYAQGVTQCVRQCGKGTAVYLLGGYTNMKDLSEARYLYRVISEVYRDVGYHRFEYVEPETRELSLYDNLQELAQRLRLGGEALDSVKLYLCCHAPRARKTWVMAQAVGFKHIEIASINFGHHSLVDRLKWFVYDTLEVAGLHFGPAQELTRRLRLKHLAAARQQAAIQQR